jgi:hypothetical protein
MVCLDASVRVDLVRGGVVRLPDGPGTRIVALAGTLWITREDDPRDVLVEAGAAFVVDRGGLTLVCAIAGPAAVLIEAAPPQAHAPVDEAAEAPVPASRAA